MSWIIPPTLLLGLGSFGTVVAVGVTASNALVVGSALGAFWDPPQQVLAGTLGFSSGALVTALSFDLFEEAFQTAGGFLAGGGLLAGAVVFVLADITLQRTIDSSSGFALLAGVRTGYSPCGLKNLNESLATSSSDTSPENVFDCCGPSWRVFALVSDEESIEHPKR